MNKLFFILLFTFTSLVGFHYLPIDSDRLSYLNISSQSEIPHSDSHPGFHFDNLEDDFLSESIGIYFSKKTNKNKLEVFLFSNKYILPSFSVWQPPKIVI